MPYMDTFNSIVTTTKRNNRYRGPTESEKVSSFLSEVKTDINTIFDEINDVRTHLDALASGYVQPSGIMNYIDYTKSNIYSLENKFAARIYTQASQTPIF